MNVSAQTTARVETILADRRRSKINKAVIYTIIVVLVIWSVKTTIIDDTDWERLGSFGDIMASIGEFLLVDWSLMPSLWKPALETIMVATLGTVLGVITCIPAIWFGALNISPYPPITYPIARLMMTLSRSIHEIVWAFVLCGSCWSGRTGRRSGDRRALDRFHRQNVGRGD